jgi:hypothetical protein
MLCADPYFAHATMSAPLSQPQQLLLLTGPSSADVPQHLVTATVSHVEDVQFLQTSSSMSDEKKMELLIDQLRKRSDTQFSARLCQVALWASLLHFNQRVHPTMPQCKVATKAKQDLCKIGFDQSALDSLHAKYLTVSTLFRTHEDTSFWFNRAINSSQSSTPALNWANLRVLGTTTEQCSWGAIDGNSRFDWWNKFLLSTSSPEFRRLCSEGELENE